MWLLETTVIWTFLMAQLSRSYFLLRHILFSASMIWGNQSETFWTEEFYKVQSEQLRNFLDRTGVTHNKTQQAWAELGQAQPILRPVVALNWK